MMSASNCWRVDRHYRVFCFFLICDAKIFSTAYTQRQTPRAKNNRQTNNYVCLVDVYMADALLQLTGAVILLIAKNKK